MSIMFWENSKMLPKRPINFFKLARCGQKTIFKNNFLGSGVRIDWNGLPRNLEKTFENLTKSWKSYKNPLDNVAKMIYNYILRYDE